MTSADEELDSEPVPPYRDLLDLSGRGALVVGAGRGIGRQTAHALSSLGAHVVCADNSEERARAVASEVGGIPVVADVFTRDGVEKLVAQAFDSRDGVPPDILVDIVGMAEFSLILDGTDEWWQRGFDVVLTHAFRLTQVAGRLMAQRGHGSIVHVASVAALGGSPNSAAYGAAKAGLVSLTRSAAHELGVYGVRVNSVAPGSILTPRVRARAAAAGGHPHPEVEALGRRGEPSDIAGAVLFLASDLARHVTGQTLAVDAGASVRGPYQKPGADFRSARIDRR